MDAGLRKRAWLRCMDAGLRKRDWLRCMDARCLSRFRSSACPVFGAVPVPFSERQDRRMNSCRVSCKGGGSRFRTKRLPCGWSSPENDPRPRSRCVPELPLCLAEPFRGRSLRLRAHRSSSTSSAESTASLSQPPPRQRADRHDRISAWGQAAIIAGCGWPRRPVFRGSSSSSCSRSAAVLGNRLGQGSTTNTGRCWPAGPTPTRAVR
jgi:hypothetical protein